MVFALLSLSMLSGTPDSAAQPTAPAAGAARRTPTPVSVGAIPTPTRARTVIPAQAAEEPDEEPAEEESPFPPEPSAPAPNTAPAATAQPIATIPAIQPAGGQLRLDYPLTLRVNKDEIVQLEIVPDQPVALVGAAPNAPAALLLLETSPNDAPRRTVSYAIPLYPAMSAELATAQSDDLNIVAGSETKQAIDPFDRNFWTWSVVARRGGEYRITLRLFGYNTLADDDPLRQVVNDTRIVQVQDAPFFERLGTGLAENWLILFGAGGPIALVVAVLTLWYTRRDSQRP
jgi:hypothetical protein